MSDTKKYHITPEGAQRLKEELDFLWRQKRPEVTQKVADAAALGDRSENADYIYGKKQLREIDARIRFLRKRIDNLEIVSGMPGNQSKIYFGAWIRLEDEEGTVSTIRIVGADEFDLKKGWISLNSPIAKCLLGKSKGEQVMLDRPKGKIEAYILDVGYRSFEDN